MKPISGFKYFQLSLFSNPACDRLVYKTVRKEKVKSIVEVGLGDSNRAVNMIRLAKKYSDQPEVRYTGVDMFEGRESGKQLNLREVHKQFGALGAKIRLVPGNLRSAIPTIANAHVRTDMIVISGDYDSPDLDAVWFYLPRMLHAGSSVLVQKPGSVDGSFQSLTRLDVERKVASLKNNDKKAVA